MKIKLVSCELRVASILRIFLLPTFYFLLSTCCLYSTPPGIDVGNKSVDFSLQEISSTATFKLSNYKGKNPVLVNFFATWCPYCAEEISELNKIQNEFGKKGLIVVSVNVQEKEDRVASFIKRKKVLYRVILDANADVASKFKVLGFPTNILIDSKGVIVFRSSNLPDEKEIKKVLPKKKKK